MAVLQTHRREAQGLRQTQHVARIVGEQTIGIPDIGDVDARVRLDLAYQLIEVGDHQPVVVQGDRSRRVDARLVDAGERRRAVVCGRTHAHNSIETSAYSPGRFTAIAPT